MNEHSDELHQVTELIVFISNNLNVELERQFISKLINLQYLELWSKDCDISIIKEFVRLKNLKRIQLCNYEHFEEFVHYYPPNLKSISVSNRDHVLRQVDFSNLNWPLEEFRFDYLTSNSIMSLLKNEIMTKNLKKLDISKSKLDENVMKEISTLSKLRELDLNSVECGDDQIQYISKLENLESLSLYNNVIISGFSNFRNLTNITKLSLMYNCINNEGANYLSSLTSLTYLNLGCNKISDEGLKNYCKLSNLLDLLLHSNQIGSIGANYLSQIPNITCLFLVNNLIGEDGLKNFGNLSKLKTLSLSNNQIGNGFEYLSNCKNISTLEVLNNNISEKSVMKYCKMKQLRVEYLNISNNPIGNSGFASLVNILKKMTTIQASGCGITDEGIFKMLKIIRFKKSMMTLHLEKNYLTNKSLKKMIESKHIDKIKGLDISNTNSELDSNYLNILSEKLDNFKYRYETQESKEPEESEEPEEKKNRCTIQ